MGRVQIAIPVAASGPERDRLHLWVMRRWFEEYRDGRGWGMAYATDNGGRTAPVTTDEFNHAKAINRAAAMYPDGSSAADDVIVICDADTFPNPWTIDGRIADALDGRWSVPGRYVNLSQKTTESVLAAHSFEQASEIAEAADDHEWEGSTSWAGVVVIRRDQFHGYDERFDGWSADDIAFAMQTETLAGPVTRSGTVYHLWHDAPRARTYDRPGFAESWALTTRYMEAHLDREATLALIEERNEDVA